MPYMSNPMYLQTFLSEPFRSMNDIDDLVFENSVDPNTTRIYQHEEQRIYESPNATLSAHYLVQRSPPRSPMSSTSSQHHSKKSLGTMLTSFRKGIIRTLSPSLNPNRGACRSKSSPAKEPEERKKREKSVPRLRDEKHPKATIKQKLEDKITNLKRSSENLTKRKNVN